MLIEKSPFYNKSSNLSIDSKTNLHKVNLEKKIEGEETSFWSWFKGLVNPLQNLPLISGIYSSINSEDENSDRDMVQNSLGGFLYGGPIGAIAGFGNWVFNKIFDKTPSEIALDIAGISDLWKEKDESKVVQKDKDKNYSNENIKISLQENNLFKSNTKNMEISELKKQNIVSNKLLSEEKVSLKTSKLENPIILEVNNPKLIKQNHLKDSKQINNKIDENKVNLSKNSTSSSFKEINFKYPTWKPEYIESKSINKKLIDKFYDEQRINNSKIIEEREKFNIDA